MIRRELVVEEVNELTEMLRHGGDEYFTQLRSMLREKGIDPQAALQASFCEDEVGNEYGVIVCGPDSVFEYVRSVAAGAPQEFTSWTKLTDLAAASVKYRQLEVALELLGQLHLTHPTR